MLERKNDPLRQQARELWEFRELDAAGGVLRREQEVLTMRWTYRHEMRYLLELAGFVVRSEWSDFRGSPPAYGKEQVWVAQRPAVRACRPGESGIDIARHGPLHQRGDGPGLTRRSTDARANPRHSARGQALQPGREHGRAVGGEDRLGMELDAFHRVVAVADAHHQAVG